MDYSAREANELGFAMLGESAFEMNHGASERQMRSQGRAVGADLVLHTSAYVGSQQTVIPTTQYVPGQTSTTYSSGNVQASAYGNRGYAHGTANYSGTSTTTTPGSYSTTYVPVTLHRHRFNVTYWRRSPGQDGLRPTTHSGGAVGGIGAVFDTHPEGFVILKLASSPEIQTASLRVNDVITSIDGKPAKGMKLGSAFQALIGPVGSPVVFTVNRNGQELAVTLHREPPNLISFPEKR